MKYSYIAFAPFVAAWLSTPSEAWNPDHICSATNCAKNQIKYKDTCVTTVTCAIDSDCPDNSWAPVYYNEWSCYSGLCFFKTNNYNNKGCPYHICSNDRHCNGDQTNSKFCYNGDCVPKSGLGGPCGKSSDCNSANLVCVNNQCSCTSNGALVSSTQPCCSGTQHTVYDNRGKTVETFMYNLCGPDPDCWETGEDIDSVKYPNRKCCDSNMSPVDMIGFAGFPSKACNTPTPAPTSPPTPPPTWPSYYFSS